MVAPCKNCPERRELCHATCERYKAYRAWCDERCEERRIRSIDRIHQSYKFDMQLREDARKRR